MVFGVLSGHPVETPDRLAAAVLNMFRHAHARKPSAGLLSGPPSVPFEQLDGPPV